jgi:hypothetical protein
MSPSRVLMPLPFKSCTAFDIPTWYFDETSCLDTIYDEDFAAFHRDEVPEFYRGAIGVQTTCVYIIEPQGGNLEKIIQQTATQFKYVLNTFSADIPIAIPFAMLVAVDAKAHVQRIWDLEPSTNIHSLRQKEFRLKPDTDASTVSEFYKIVQNSCGKHSPLLFTLDRFNSSLTRSNLFDRIVDMTISLESLLSGKEELRFKFALYNSFIAAATPDERWDHFKILLKLYDARSGIVHGEADNKTIDYIDENWAEVVKIASASLNYHLIFLNSKPRGSWDEHLKHLVFAKTERMV